MSLKQYESANDGSWGWLSRYYELVIGKPSAEFTANDWAYLTGYFTQRTNEAIAERDALKAENERLRGLLREADCELDYFSACHRGRDSDLQDRINAEIKEKP